MIYDVRTESAEEITDIVFADKDSETFRPVYQAYFLTKGSNCLLIRDGSESVIVSSAAHASDLIRALQKAIDIDWIK